MKDISQGEANKLLQGAHIDLGCKYAHFSTTMAISLYFSSLLPIGLFICFLGSIYQYWVEKFCLLYFCNYRRPVLFSSKISQFYIDSYPMILFCYPLGQLFLTPYKPYISLIFIMCLYAFSAHKNFYINFIGEEDEEINKLTYDKAKENFITNYNTCNPMKDIDYEAIKSKLSDYISLNTVDIDKNNVSNNNSDSAISNLMNVFKVKDDAKSEFRESIRSSRAKDLKYNLTKKINKTIVNLPNQVFSVLKKMKENSTNPFSKLVENSINKTD